MLTGGLRSGAVDTTSLIYNERNSIVAEFCRRVQAVIWNRALIKTENDDLGLASDKVRRGDMVCILYGCTVPVILRKGKWKTKEMYEKEKFEDGVEAMEKLVRKCAENKARKIRWKEKKLTMKESELNEIKMQTSVFNNIKIKEERQVEKNEEGKEERKEGEKEEDKEEEKQENEEEKEDKKEEEKREENGCETGEKNSGESVDSHDRSDYESDDETDSETEGKDKTMIKLQKQKRANEKDPYRHYQFLGEAYIHGKMDGDAVRRNFYKLKPDHLFEIR